MKLFCFHEWHDWQDVGPELKREEASCISFVPLVTVQKLIIQARYRGCIKCGKVEHKMHRAKAGCETMTVVRRYEMLYGGSTACKTNPWENRR